MSTNGGGDPTRVCSGWGGGDALESGLGGLEAGGVIYTLARRVSDCDICTQALRGASKLGTSTCRTLASMAWAWGRPEQACMGLQEAVGQIHQGKAASQSLCSGDGQHPGTGAPAESQRLTFHSSVNKVCPEQRVSYRNSDAALNGVSWSSVLATSLP